MSQLSINFCNRVENNRESNAILQANRDSINKSCLKVLELLESGVRLTVYDAMVKYGISSLPRRVADLKEKGIMVKDRLIDKRYKEYYL